MFVFKSGGLLALAGLMVFAFACGGSSDDSSSTSTAGASASPGRSASPGTTGSPSAGAGGSPGASPSAPSGSATASPGASAPAGSPAPAATIDIATPISEEAFEPAAGEYCNTVTQTSPPNSIIGLLEVDGADAPAGTDVMVAFDGVPGPVKASREAGGYRVDFGVASDDGCANVEGAEISIVVGGVEYETGRVVGSAAAIRFDILG